MLAIYYVKLWAGFIGICSCLLSVVRIYIQGYTFADTDVTLTHCTRQHFALHQKEFCALWCGKKALVWLKYVPRHSVFALLCTLVVYHSGLKNLHGQILWTFHVELKCLWVQLEQGAVFLFPAPTCLCWFFPLLCDSQPKTLVPLLWSVCSQCIYIETECLQETCQTRLANTKSLRTEIEKGFCSSSPC